MYATTVSEEVGLGFKGGQGRMYRRTLGRKGKREIL